MSARIHIDPTPAGTALAAGAELLLPANASRHVQVLRLQSFAVRVTQRFQAIGHGLAVDGLPLRHPGHQVLRCGQGADNPLPGDADVAGHDV